MLEDVYDSTIRYSHSPMKNLDYKSICLGPLAHISAVSGGNEQAGRSAVLKSPAIQRSAWLEFAYSPGLICVVRVSSLRIMASISTSVLQVHC